MTTAAVPGATGKKPRWTGDWSDLFNDVLAMPTYYDPAEDETAEYLLELEGLSPANFSFS